MINNYLKSTLNRGLAFIKSGDFAEAEATFSTVLKADPNNINALYFSAISVLELTQPQKAENFLISAIRLNKKIPSFHFTLGQAYEAQGKLNEAIKAFKTTVKLDPKNELAHINCGVVYGSLDKLNEAIACCRAALRINHENVLALTNLGQFLWRQGNNAAAKKMLLQALELQPDFAQALSHIGAILFSEDNLEPAEKYLRKAYELCPTHPEVLGNLTGVLLAKGGEDEEELIDFCREAIELSPDYPNAYFNLARALETTGQWNEVVSAYSKVIELQPDFKLAYMGLVNAKKNLGQFDEAKALIRSELEKNEYLLGAYSELLSLEDPHIIRGKLEFIEQLYNQQDDEDLDKWNAAFALAKFYENDKQYEKSFAFLKDGNRLKRVSFEYDIATEQSFFNSIKTTFTKDFITNKRSLGSTDITPIFIIGMPRSGTTLTEQILASHSQVFGAGELKFIHNHISKLCKPAAYEQFPEIIASLDESTYRQIATQYMDKITKCGSGSPRITDKMPHNFLHLGIIHTLFPNAKIIHCRRDPMDNCLSIFKLNFEVLHKYAYDLVELGNYYLLYQDLMEHWQSVILQDSFLEVRYEETVSNQEEMTKRILQFCDLPWDENCLQFHKTERVVETASAQQVRRKIYTDSVKLWKQYEQELQPLIDVLRAGGAL